MNNDININDTVRSFDFDMHRDLTGERACYIEGIVTGFTHLEGCERYAIRVTREVWGGEEVEIRRDQVFPPVNETRSWLGGTTNNVEQIEAA
jgi:hypothetical protein